MTKRAGGKRAHSHAMIPYASMMHQEAKDEQNRRALGNVSNRSLETTGDANPASKTANTAICAAPRRRSLRLASDRNRKDETTAVAIKTTTNGDKVNDTKKLTKGKSCKHSDKGTKEAFSKSRYANRTSALNSDSGGNVEDDEKKPAARGQFKAKKTNDSSKRSRSRSTSESELPAKEARTDSKRYPRSAQETNYNMAIAGFDSRKFTNGIAPVDKRNRHDPLEAPEYVSDIFQRLFQAEMRFEIKPYMHRQTEVTASMRTILVDWMVEVSGKFRLGPDTLHLAVHIVDRYLSKKNVRMARLQLVGITALLIASKYEEIYPPEVRDCVYLCERAFTRQDLLDMEVDILNQLGFMLTVPTAFPFLTRFLFICDATPIMKKAATYYLERMLQEYDIVGIRYSLLAAAAACLAINHDELREYDEGGDEGPPGVPQILKKYTGFTANEIHCVAVILAKKISQEYTSTGTSRRDLCVVKRKYDSSRFDHVSGDFSPPDADLILADQS